VVEERPVDDPDLLLRASDSRRGELSGRDQLVGRGAAGAHQVRDLGNRRWWAAAGVASRVDWMRGRFRVWFDLAAMGGCSGRVSRRRPKRQRR